MRNRVATQTGSWVLRPTHTASAAFIIRWPTALTRKARSNPSRFISCRRGTIRSMASDRKPSRRMATIAGCVSSSGFIGVASGLFARNPVAEEVFQPWHRLVGVLDQGLRPKDLVGVEGGANSLTVLLEPVGRLRQEI